MKSLLLIYMRGEEEREGVRSQNNTKKSISYTMKHHIIAIPFAELLWPLLGGGHL